MYLGDQAGPPGGLSPDIFLLMIAFGGAQRWAATHCATEHHPSLLGTGLNRRPHAMIKVMPFSISSILSCACDYAVFRAASISGCSLRAF